MHRSILLKMSLFILGIFAALCGTADSVLGSPPAAYTTIGLGGLNPASRTDIVAYVPGLTLLYELGQQSVNVRKRNDPTVRRPYRAAVTQDGITLLLLDDTNTIERRVSKLARFEFLVNRPLPVCMRPDGCAALNLWNRFDAGKSFGIGWYTVWPRQGGKFIAESPDPDEPFWEVEFLDNLDGWVRRVIPSKKEHRSVEDLGYITRLDRPHPLFRFEEVAGKRLTTQCTETVRKLSRDDLIAELRVFGKLGAEIAAQPNIPIPFGNKLLKFLGVDAEIKAEASIEGSATFTMKRESETEIRYGAVGQSWVTKSVRFERVREDRSLISPEYEHYGNILIKKIYACEGDVRTYMRNVNITIFLGDMNAAVDFEDPLPALNINHQVVENIIGLQPNPEYPALVSLKGQKDYNKIMSYLLLEKGLPRSIAAFIIKEINLSPPLD